MEMIEREMDRLCDLYDITIGRRHGREITYNGGGTKSYFLYIDWECVGVLFLKIGFSEQDLSISTVLPSEYGKRNIEHNVQFGDRYDLLVWFQDLEIILQEIKEKKEGENG